MDSLRSLCGCFKRTNNERFKDKYVKIKEIGKGGFGSVFLAKEKKTNNEVIVKFIKHDKINERHYDAALNLPNEVVVMQQLSHENIIKLITFYNDTEKRCIQLVMEKHGDSMDLVHLNTSVQRPFEFLYVFIFRQIVAAVSYMHRHHFIHGDIKMDNVIVDRQFRVKLIDFGASRYRDPDQQDELPANFFCVTRKYLPPEILSRSDYTGYPQDVWQLGILLYSLLFNKFPYGSADEIASAHLRFPKTKTLRYSGAHCSLLLRMLNPHVDLRLTIAQVETNSWVCQKRDTRCLNWDAIMGSPDQRIESSFS